MRWAVSVMRPDQQAAMTSQPWWDLNRRMVAAASDPQRGAQAEALLQEAARRWPEHLGELVLGWCDTLAVAAKVTTYGPHNKVFGGADVDTAEQLLNPRQLSVSEVWAQEIITARWRSDQARFLELMAGANRDGTLGRKLPVLLRLVGHNLAGRAAGRWEGI